MPNVVQRSFAAGEVSGQMAARADQVRHATGLKTCRNFLTTRTGSVVNRAGTRHLATVQDVERRPRVIGFIYSNDDAYAIEVGHHYLRFYRDRVRQETSNGGEPSWVTSTAYEAGEVVTVLMPQYVCIVAHTSGVSTEPGTGADWQLYWYELPVLSASRFAYELPTPYDDADLFDITFVQKGDILTLTHVGYAPRELRRWDLRQWELAVISFVPTIVGPTNIAGSGSTGSTVHEYAVTAVKAISYEESLPGVPSSASATITNIVQQGRTFDITAAAHGFEHGDYVTFSGIVGTGRIDGLNGRGFRIGAVATNTFEVKDHDAQGEPNVGTYTSGGVAKRASSIVVADPVSTADPITLTWDAAEDATEYNIYRKKHGVFAYVGTTAALEFEDDGITPDLSSTPPVERVPFAGENDYPACVGYFQQRQIFASTNNKPETVWPSQVGAFHNLSARSPVLDDDSFSFTVDGQRVNRIRHMVDIGKLILLSEGGEHTVQGDSDGVLRPTAINLHQEGYSGIWKVAPIVIGNSAVFVSGRGNAVCGLRYDFSTDGFPSNDLTIYARHLFDGYTINDWGHALVPFGIVWSIRSDGTMLGMTLLPEQDVIGWHRHDTGDGDAFESTCSIPENGEDAVYVVVRRTVNGATTRAIEVFERRRIDDLVTDAWFVDAGCEWDGRYSAFGAETPTLVTLSGGTLWDHTETLTLSDLDTNFLNVTTGGVCAYGDQLVLVAGDETLALDVLSFDSGTETAQVRPVRPVPESMRDTPIADWRWARKTIRAVRFVTGLEVTGPAHLEGRTVSVFADGGVQSQKVVTSGVVTLDTPAVQVRVGLPIEADVELLDIEDSQGETLLTRQKLTVEASLQVLATRGIYAGPDEDHLQQYVQREDENWDESTELATGVVDVCLDSSWNNHGRVLIRQSDPLPIEVLAVVRRCVIGGR